MRKKLIVLTTILGLLAFSGVAAADEHETGESGDTTFNFGYDEDNGVFIWGSFPSDGETDCALNGELKATYAEGDNGGLLLEDLVHLEGGESVDSDCALTAAEVAGPQGQVNHGMFLKTFNAMFDGKARGCMVRHIAQTGLGKDTEQVKVSEVDPEAEGVQEGDTGEIDFETVMTDCLHGPDDAEVEGASNGKGRPDRVTDKLENKGGDDEAGRRGPPDHAQGKGPKG